MRRVRGREIAMIFQEPMTALNPLLTIGRQIAEMVVRHENLSRRAARAQGDRHAAPRAACRSRSGAPATIRISCPAACASAR